MDDLAGEPMKVVVSRESPRGDANSLRSEGHRMGILTQSNKLCQPVMVGNVGNRNIQVPTGKENNCDSVSNGE